MIGYEAHFCFNEDEARELVSSLPKKGKWPCLFTKSDTTGEKDFEEFFMENEKIDIDRFENLGIVKSNFDFNVEELNIFKDEVHEMKESLCWTKPELVKLFHKLLPGFDHKETGKYLDSKM